MELNDNERAILLWLENVYELMNEKTENLGMGSTMPDVVIARFVKDFVNDELPEEVSSAYVEINEKNEVSEMLEILGEFIDWSVDSFGLGEK